MGLINVGNIIDNPIQEGDAGIVFRRDGGFQVFNTHQDIDEDNLTDVQLYQAETLMALAVALHNPKIMEILKQMSVDPKVVGDDPLQIGALH